VGVWLRSQKKYDDRKRKAREQSGNYGKGLVGEGRKRTTYGQNLVLRQIMEGVEKARGF